ncbi:MAG: GNAT family N-acetyltransferase, partial [bacterium]
MITVKTANPTQRPIAALIAQLDACQSSLYPAASNHFDSQSELAAAQAHFVAAYEGARVLGCGAIKYLRGDCAYGEIKRVFVAREARGRG